MDDDNQPATVTGRTRYALCGLSVRGISVFAGPLLGRPDRPPIAPDTAPYADAGELVAILDRDADRVEQYRVAVDAKVPWYSPEQFDRMVTETRPDVILVATPDHTHVDYVLSGLTAGLDVIVEKPMVTSAEDAARVIAAAQDSPGTVRVTHNLRYAPRHQRLRQLIADGAVGRVTSVELVWNVGARHGASYFRRWNRTRARSGGLSIHKSCHHFDLVGWLIDAVPEQVFAYGARNFFGADSPHNPGRELTAAERTEADPYRWYETASAADAGPVRDSVGLSYPDQYPQRLSAYDPEIDIEDTYSVVVRYRGGASLNYSIQFSAPWEGYRLAVNGTHGRLETDLYYDVEPLPPAGSTPITHYPLFGAGRAYPVDGEDTGHLGADPLLVADLFRPTGDDPLGCRADAQAGAYAVAVGEAVWRSIKDNRPVNIADLLRTEAGG
ncbi:putative dehydrogenase [Hamadaea flava]|uniref:Gfo/Idh/MocA family protein n=1 Tax=Hamadaea flava TaxID=1742688 RepID=A0ABV8LHL0_9ACTN|nr:Gfo/Idh/MocA family oxidoreductase [Hamadaea flava]MCP2324232.1 putative dehydrogenase [Hamadaea flava]